MLIILKPRSLFNLSSICKRPDSHTCFLLFYFVSLEVSLFPITFCSNAVFSLHGEYAVRVFLPDGVFLPSEHGLNFLHQLIWEINQSIKKRCTMISAALPCPVS